MTNPTIPPQSQLAPCSILCDACPLGGGEAADRAAGTRKHIAGSQIPAWSPFVPS